MRQLSIFALCSTKTNSKTLGYVLLSEIIRQTIVIINSLGSRLGDLAMSGKIYKAGSRIGGNEPNAYFFTDV